MNSKHFEISFFIVLMLMATALIGFIFFPFLDAIVIAITLAVLFHPVYQAIKSIMPKFDGIASFLTLLIAIIIILAPLTFFGFKIFNEAQNLYTGLVSDSATPVITFFHKQLNRITPWLNIDIKQYIEQMIGLLVGNLGLIISKFSNIAMMVFLSLIAFYFLLKDSLKLKNAIIKISPLSEKNTNKIIFTLGDTIKTVIRGSLIVTIVQGILIGLGFWIFGLDNPVLWGSVSIVASLIPVIGASLVIIPGIISLVISGNILAAIGLTAWSILLVGTSDNFLRPYLIGNNSNVHPLLVLFSVIGGLVIFGATGFLLGPLALSFFLTLVEIFPAIVSE